MNLENITPEKLNHLVATKQAKAWGFKSIADAKKNGYNTIRVSMSIKEISDALKITREEANMLADSWNYNGLANRVCHADLNCIYFKSK